MCPLFMAESNHRRLWSSERPIQQLGPYQMVSEPTPSTANSSSSMASDGVASLKIFLDEFRADLSTIFSSIRHDLSSINSSLDRCIDHAKGSRATVLSESPHQVRSESMSSSGSIDIHETVVDTQSDSWVKIMQEPQPKSSIASVLATTTESVKGIHAIETRSFKIPSSSVCSEIKDVCGQTQAITESVGITKSLAGANGYSHLSVPHHDGPDVLGATLPQLDRFDRQDTVDRPDVAGSVQKLQVHSRGKVLAKVVIFEETAIFDTLESIVAGPGKKTEVVQDVKKTLAAYHEPRNILLGTLMPTKISILPRGQAGVLAMFAPNERRQESGLYCRNNPEDQMASDMKEVIPLRPPPKPPPRSQCSYQM